MENNSCDTKALNIETVKEVKSKMANDEIIDKLTNFFKVFGDFTRAKLLIALLEQELCVSDLANILDRKKSIISHQLKTLKEAKLVKSKKVGRVVYYSLDDDHVSMILKMANEHILEKRD